MKKKDLRIYFNRLEGKDGCNFRKDDNGNITWDCKGGKNKDFSYKILKDMNLTEAEIEGFMEYCEDNGGYCDCEIIFNVRDNVL